MAVHEATSPSRHISSPHLFYILPSMADHDGSIRLKKLIDKAVEHHDQALRATIRQTAVRNPVKARKDGNEHASQHHERSASPRPAHMSPGEDARSGRGLYSATAQPTAPVNSIRDNLSQQHHRANAQPHQDGVVRNRWGKRDSIHGKQARVSSLPPSPLVPTCEENNKK